MRAGVHKNKCCHEESPNNIGNTHVVFEPTLLIPKLFIAQVVKQSWKNKINRRHAEYRDEVKDCRNIWDQNGTNNFHQKE